MGGSLTDKDYSEDEFMDANPANKILNSARFSNRSSLVRVEGLSKGSLGAHCIQKNARKPKQVPDLQLQKVRNH